jgi:2,5-diamino-6-(ribosylamino)-4(3H)-pyrimidinone 5'-phosphate reductase
VVAGTRGFLAVVDSRGRVRWSYKELPDADWAGWHLLVLVARTTPPAYLAYLRAEQIPYLVVGQDRVDLPEAVRRLHDRLGASTLLSTAGGRLQGALLRAGLVDEIDLEILPAVIGGRGTPALFDGSPLGPFEQPCALRPLAIDVMADGRILARYAVARTDLEVRLPAEMGTAAT